MTRFPEVGNVLFHRTPCAMSNIVTINGLTCNIRGVEWYLEKRGSRKILVESRNLESGFDKSRSLIFAWFDFYFFESRNILPRSLGLEFLTRISASRGVSNFTVRHPKYTDLTSNTHTTFFSSDGSAVGRVLSL